jgi:hypothetical protein
MRTAWPRLPELAGRVVLSAALVLVLGHQFGPGLCRALLPLLAATLKAMAPDFTLLSTDVVRDGLGSVLQVAATPAHALLLNGRLLQPFGTGAMPPGGFLVSATVGGALQSSELALIAALAWPSRTLREYLLRAGLALALASALLIAVPLTLAAELWGAAHDLAQSGQVPAVLVASRLLMGGGGAALGLATAAMTVRLAALFARTSASESGPLVRARRRWARQPRQPRQPRLSRCSRCSCEPRHPGAA